MEAKNVKEQCLSLNNLKPDNSTSNTITYMYNASKDFIMKRENQRKILKAVGSISSTIILSGYAFKLIPLLTPNLTKSVYLQFSEAFPGLLESIDLIPKNQIRKISSNLCIFTGIASGLLGKDGTSGSVKAYRSLNSKELL